MNNQIDIWKYNLSNHLPTLEGKKVIDQIRTLQIDTAEFLINKLPECREKEIALQKIEESTMYAIVAISRNLTKDKDLKK